MANIEGDNIRRHNLSYLLPKELQPLLRDVPYPSKYLLGDDLQERINRIKTNQKMLKSDNYYPYKNSKNLNRFCKNPGNQKKGYQHQQHNKGWQNQQKYSPKQHYYKKH